MVRRQLRCRSFRRLGCGSFWGGTSLGWGEEGRRCVGCQTGLVCGKVWVWEQLVEMSCGVRYWSVVKYGIQLPEESKNRVGNTLSRLRYRTA